MFSFWSKKPEAETIIVVRTKNRPELFSRALKSIHQQTYTKWHVAIINDGGDSQTIQQIADSELPTKSFTLFSLSPPSGSNSGRPLNEAIQRTNSKYVAIHDDDDSWNPSFLAATIAQMEKENTIACVSRCYLVQESWNGSAYEEKSREIYQSWQDKGISLFRLAESNTFPPISLVYRRQAWESVGPYPDHCLEDWLFHLRLLARYEISFLSEILANYHQRSDGPDATEESLRARLELYGKIDIKIRNKLLREDLAQGKIGLGFLVNMAQSQGRIHQMIEAPEKQS